MELVNTTALEEPHMSKIIQAAMEINHIIEQSNHCGGLQEKLDELSPELPRHTIYKVHSILRDMHNEAYEPKLIAIGPYHSHNENLKKMEIHKLRYVKALLGREGKSIQDCVSAIESREREARECYAEPINLNSIEFLEMLVLDGCFIIECVRRYFSGVVCSDDPLLSKGWVRYGIKWDLMLFENQIPFFVISQLSDSIYGPMAEGGVLMRSLLEFFEDLYPVQVYYKKHNDSTNVKHLLDLIHRSFVLTYEDVHAKDPRDMDGKSSREGHYVFTSAARLVESNVTLERTAQGDSMFQIDFENGTMRLPLVSIDDATESFLRNLIAYEQYFLDSKQCYFTDFATFLDRLINSAEDVKMLIKCGIIENCLGSEEAVADVFNKLTDHVMLSPGDYFTYKWHYGKVREHCSLRRNAWMAKLKRNYLNSPWAIISIVAAIVLLILTFLQTVFTIKSK